MDDTVLPPTRVEVHGLTSVQGSQHNGKLGTTIELLNPADNTRRVAVILDEAIGLNKRLNIKIVNLKISTAPPLSASGVGMSELELELESLFVQSNESGLPLESIIGNDWSKIASLILMVWHWMRDGGDVEKSREFLERIGVTRATMNMVAYKRLHRIPPEFYMSNSPIPLPPRAKKQMFSKISGCHNAADQLCQTQPQPADGYAFLLTHAGGFSFMHYPNSGPLSCPEIEESNKNAVPPTWRPVDFYPFTIQESCFADPQSQGVSDFAKAKYDSLQVVVPNFGHVISRGWSTIKSKKETKRLKSANAFYFDAFCAVCHTPSCGTISTGTLKTRGSHGMILMSLMQIAKGVAFAKPEKRLIPFEKALKAASQLLTIRLARTYTDEQGESGEQWRNLILPRNDEEAKLAQAIEVINLSTINYILGEIVESRGDYLDAAKRYKWASMAIEHAIKPGEALASFHGIEHGESLVSIKHLAIILNSYGLALKRCGKFKESIKAYKKSLSYDKDDSCTQSNLMSCQIAMKHGLIQNQDHMNGGLKSYLNVPSNNQHYFCSLPECSTTGEKKDFMLCSRCRNHRYCSHEHQKSDWPRHKKECKKLKKEKQKK